MNERDLEKLSKVDLIKMVQKLQKKARKPKITIVDNDYKQVPQPIAKSQKPPRHIPPRDPQTGQFVKINPDRPKLPKQRALPRLRDAKGNSSRDVSQNSLYKNPFKYLRTKSYKSPLKDHQG